MAASTYDAIVVGAGGGVGSATFFHLARQGLRVLGIDRFPPGHDRGSSHGETRAIRLAYFEHPDYVPLLRRAYELWDELTALRGEELLRRTGLVEVGPEDGEVVRGVLASSRLHGLDVETLSSKEAEARFPGLRIPSTMTAVFEREGGFLHVEACVRAHAELGREAGGALEIGSPVVSWTARESEVAVRTSTGEHRAARLIVAGGAWSSDLLADLRVPLLVLRKPLYWFDCPSPAYRLDAGFPVFLFERPEGIFYGFPALDEHGVKCAEHTSGESVAKPSEVDRSERSADRERLESFLRVHLPGVNFHVTRHSVCLYTITPDRDFVVDRHPAHPNVVFAAGLSGHGFKFATVLGEILADLAVDGRTRHPIEFLRLDRPALRAEA